jgi:DNA-binding MarR family transcriptional regulator
MAGDSNGRQQAQSALRDLNLAATTFRHALAAHYRVSVSDTHAVSYLAAAGPLGQTDLASRLSLSTSAVTSLLDRLEAGGVVERRPHPSDRRRSEVALTAAGHATVVRVRERMEALFESIPAADLEVAASVMSVLAERLGGIARDLAAEPARSAGA